MNRKLLVFAMLLVSAFASLGAGQVKKVTEMEYKAAIKAASEGSRRRIRRIETTQTITNGIIIRNFHHIEEHLPPKRYRSVSTKTEGMETFVQEDILIKRNHYLKLGSDPWRKFDLRRRFVEQYSPSGIPVISSNEYFVAAEVLGGLQMQVFKHKYISNSDPNGFFNEIKTWIGTDGLVYREEEVSGTLLPRSENSRRISTYTYDPTPKIKIEAPMR